MVSESKKRKVLLRRSLSRSGMMPSRIPTIPRNVLRNGEMKASLCLLTAPTLFPDLRFALRR